MPWMEFPHCRVLRCARHIWLAAGVSWVLLCASLAAADEPVLGPDGNPLPAPQPAPQPNDNPADRAEPPEPPLGDPAPVVTPTVADYLPFFRCQIDRPDESLKDLQAFLNHALPVATPEATAMLTENFTHVNKLKVVDCTHPLIDVAFLPRQVFTLKPGNLATPPVAYKPLWVECVPITDKQAYLDTLGEVVDEIRADGEYYSTQFPHETTRTWFKVIDGYAVFCSEKAGVDAGLQHLAKPAAAAVAAPAAPRATARYSLPIHALLVGANQTTPTARQTVIRTLAVAWARAARDLRRRGRGARANGPNDDIPFNDDPAELAKSLEALLAFADEIDQVEATVYLNADSARLGFAIEALADTNLAKAIAGLPPVDPAAIHGVKGIDPVLFWSGTYDALQVRMLKIIAPMYAARFQPMMTASAKIAGQVQGARYSGVLGFDAKGVFGAAVDLRLPAGADAQGLFTAGAKAFEPLIKDAVLPMRNGDKVVPMQLAFTAGDWQPADGWQVADWVYSFKPQPPKDGPAPGPETETRFTAQLATRDGRVVAGISTRDQATSHRASWLDGQTPLALDAAVADRLKKNAEDHHGVMVAGFQPYPWVLKLLRDNLGDPKLEKLAADSIGKAPPLVIEGSTVGRRLQFDVTLEADTVKRYSAFGLGLQKAFLGHDADGNPPGPAQPPGGPDDVF